MTPLFYLQVVHVATGTVVRLPGGGALERELVAACLAAITSKCVGAPTLLERDVITACVEASVARGVGLFRTEAHVRRAIAAGIADGLRTKQVGLFQAEAHSQAVGEGLEEALRAVKTATKAVVR